MGRNKGLKMDLKGGRPKTGQNLRRAFEETNAVDEGAKAAVNVYRKHSPVVTGNMRGRWGLVAGSRRWTSNDVLVADVVNTAPYTRRVDRTSRRNKGFLDRAAKEAAVEVPKVVGARAASIVHHLWDQDEK